ncbi:hypothetical protein M408DRAFT_9371 [Serendipita vermifera MAFF 305830]|uniref:Uncharacterized protein n=1 Tax=Serendipita vermifera MAFF 305830 TaxID=933852 RepID=A0A0C2WMD6_SERVB|nr:hypothetical protein M408DRAFT_9371 [Serendipita vermifera MAFF 305830]
MTLGENKRSLVPLRGNGGGPLICRDGRLNIISWVKVFDNILELSTKNLLHIVVIDPERTDKGVRAVRCGYGRVADVAQDVVVNSQEPMYLQCISPRLEKTFGKLRAVGDNLTVKSEKAVLVVVHDTCEYRGEQCSCFVGKA